MSLTLIALALTLAGLQTAPSPATAPGALTGVVTAAGAARPVTRATVRLTTEDGRDYASSLTDGAGRFSFEGVAGGTYRVRATRDGYVPAEFGQRYPDRPGQTVEVAPGQNVAGIAIAMTPAGTISGRVRDIYGEPVVNATVEALRYRYQDGRRAVARVQTATTNDLGEYRLFWMQPGEYVVRVSGTPGGSGPVHIMDGLSQAQLQVGIRVAAVEITSSSGMQTWGLLNEAGTPSFAPVYYPGTTDPSQAVVVGLRAGSEFPGVDMLRAEETMTTVRGRVVDPRSGTLPGGTVVRLVPRAGILVEGETDRSVRVGDDGTFEIPNVLPGLYDLTASLNATQAVFRTVTYNQSSIELEAQGVTRLRAYPTQRAEDAVPPLFARARLDVRAGAGLIENLVLELTPGLQVTGRVSLPPGRTLDLSVLRVQFREDRPLYGVAPNARVAEDGTFTLTGLPPAEYRGIRLTGLPADIYVESARLGAVEALDSPFAPGAGGVGNLDIRLETNPGAVDLATLGRSGERLADMTVVLVPDPARRSREDLYRVAQSDRNALVRFENVPPGDYRVFAWDRVVDGAWQNADFIRRHENSGIPIRVSPGGTESASVTVIP
jgi:hypothetical protein